jgi:hypothetical protein
MSQPIEYRQLFARMYASRVRHGKLFTERAAEVLQQSKYEDALADLSIARSFFPDNEKLPQLIRLVRKKMQQNPTTLASGGLPKPVKRSSRSVPSFGHAPED